MDPKLDSVSFWTSGRWLSSSVVKTLAKNKFSSAAISASSVFSTPSAVFNGPMLVLVFVFDLM